MRLIIPWLALVGFSVPLVGQDSIHFVPADRVAVRVMREVPSIDVAPGVHVRTVVGSTGSFSLGDFDAGGVAPLHHHTREQADVGISGVFDVTLGNHVEAVGPGAGVIIPPNVTHSIANVRGGVMTIIEGHTVPRPDLVPPRPTMTFPASPEPAALPGDRKIVVQLDKSDREQSGAATTIVGETSTLAWRRLETGAAPTNIPAARMRGELFVYIVRGDAGLFVSGKEQRVGAGTLVVIPAAEQGVRMRAIGTTDVAIVEFSPERR
jgi:quercetin dioxygenase-like cupin family protein